MRRTAFAVVVVSFFLIGQSLFVSCYAQTVSTGKPPKVAPIAQVPNAPLLTPEQREKIREIVREETSSWRSGVAVLVAVLLGLFGLILWQSVGGLKKKARSHITDIAKLLEQAQKIVEEIQTIRDKAKERAEEYSAEIKATGEEILADLGKTFTHRPRYVLTQGGTIENPSWEFDLVIFGTNVKSSMIGLLRTSGGTAFNELTEEDKAKREWHECTIKLLEENTAILLQRPLIGEDVGKSQQFHSKNPPATMTIKAKSVRVWDGNWSGYGTTNKDLGALILYLD